MKMISGLKLCKRIKERGIKKVHLAAHIGISRQALNVRCNNGTSRADINLLDKLCEALECEPGDLLVERDQ